MKFFSSSSSNLFESFFLLKEGGKVGKSWKKKKNKL